jgi:hypothetical protein
MENYWTKENCDKLQETCEKTANLLKENVDGSLMYSQLVFLADLIKEYKANPIIYYSGVLNVT